LWFEKKHLIIILFCVDKGMKEQGIMEFFFTMFTGCGDSQTLCLFVVLITSTIAFFQGEHTLSVFRRFVPGALGLFLDFVFTVVAVFVFVPLLIEPSSPKQAIAAAYGVTAMVGDPKSFKKGVQDDDGA
jgi:hypothetical protein